MKASADVRPATVQLFTEEWIPAVKALNERLMAGGLERELVYPETPEPQFPRREGIPIYQEQYLVVEDRHVRGGFILTHEEWRIHGQRHYTAHYRLPLSEGVVNPAFRHVAGQLMPAAFRRQPYLYSVGMGGLASRVANYMKKNGWELTLVPFYFRVTHPFRFLRDFSHLRKSTAKRLVMDAAAFSGTGPLAVHAFNALRTRRVPRDLAITTTPVESFGTWADEIWERSHPHYAVIGPRDSCTLNARYARPGNRYIRLRFDRDGKPVGWALLLDTRMQANKYFGSLRVGAVVDALAPPDDIWPIASAAAGALARRGADLIVTNQSHESWGPALQKCGFLKGPSNYAFAAAPELARLIGPLEKNLPTFHVNRTDGPGPTRL